MEKIQELQFDIQTWSDKQFGGNRSAIPMLYHLQKENIELISGLKKLYRIKDPKTLKEADKLADKIHEIKMEYADCFMLLMDSAAHFGFTMEVITRAIAEKLEINKKREWGEADKNGVVEHIRESVTR